MKLTEQQLSQLFKQSKTTSVDSSIENLNDFSQASDARIAAVEKIADNSHLSASYKVINQLQDWSKSVADELATLSTRQSPLDAFFAWFKPVMATAALASIVYISYPQFDNSPHATSSLASTTTNKAVFTANFEDTPSTQPAAKISNNSQSDIIYSGGFG